MSSTHNPVTHEAAERLHRAGVQEAERLDQIICGLMTALARAKGLELPEPVQAYIHRDHPGPNRTYAVWQLMPHRGLFLARVELCGDDALAHLFLKAALQSRFWEREAKRFSEDLCNATRLVVDVERTQTDGIVSYSATVHPA